MITGALSAVGGQKYLEQQAVENPVAFMTLLGKIVPKDVNLGGQPENPVNHNMSISPVLTPEQWAATFGPPK